MGGLHRCVEGSPGAGEGGRMNEAQSPFEAAGAGSVGVRRVPVPAGCVILLAVRWYLHYGLSYRDLEELLAERDIEVGHVTFYRWAQRFTPDLIVDAARPCRHAVGDRWFDDDTYVKVNGIWRCVYRSVDPHGQVIDILVCRRRDVALARTFFTTSMRAHRTLVEVITDRAAALANVIEDLIPAALHQTGQRDYNQYQSNRCEADHGQLTARLRPVRDMLTDLAASVVIRGQANIWNLRCGDVELGVEVAPVFWRATEFDELWLAICLIPPSPPVPNGP